MISSSHALSERSLLLVASALVWAACVPQPLVSASPLTKSSPIESKAAGETPSDYLGGEEETPTALETLTKLLSSQPQLRLLARPVDSQSADGSPMPAVLFSRKEDPGEGNDNARLAKLLQSYFLSSNSNNRLPRRFGPTSKRAAAMGVDLPDYILHINKGRNFDFSSFREKMQKSG